ncbi:small-conductance mechanosensitive channel [Rhizobium petrolearium]|uniref:mechanosensitive ion channel family protein n=1 Tax=Neorhizobium petrolearium TaxID=515361 RepID=UPI001AE31EC3|nr:mechanosensitive ion channel domain-containing protein [Neorhizobium petrolearium]MBP1844159.1 small-conductance mechanosensitive channel [Neorhizobium petrolearium]
MDENTSSTGLALLVIRLQLLVEQFMEGLHARYLAWLAAPAEYEEFRASLAEASTSAFALGSQIVLIVLLVAVPLFLAGRRIQKSTGTAWRRLFLLAASAATALAIGFLVARAVATQGLPQQTLQLWATSTVAGWMVLVALHWLLLPSVPRDFRLRPGRLTVFVRDLSFPVIWAVTGLALISTLRLWSAGAGLVDLLGTGLVAVPTLILFGGAVWRHRRTLAGAVAGPRPRAAWRSRFARSWPAIVIGFIILIVANAQLARTLGVALPGGAVMMTALVVIATPHLDAIIWDWGQRGLQSPNISAVAAAWRQTARFAVLIVMLASLGALWATPLAVGFGIDLRHVAFDAFKVALIGMFTAFCWNLIGTSIERVSRADQMAAADHAAPGSNMPSSRLGTLVPLFGSIGKSLIVAFAILSMLVTVGVNVWPLITGLSFFGLAVSFGAQALVKDVVSGLFFLIDDAFRYGEYIETTGAKGTVEKISIRSVSLRGSRGPIATVPYGQMGKIQNFSRDWVIEKIALRVAMETDTELVRKIFKTIGEQIAADPELSPNLLQPLKSQGSTEVEDGTLIVKAKFMAKPGTQFPIRKAAMKAILQAFRENGIRAVPKPFSGDIEQRV